MRKLSFLREGAHFGNIAGALFSALLCAASATASGATIKWTGGGDGTTWGNGDNWGGTAPGAEDEARLETPTSVIQIGSETTVSNITAATTGSANVQLSVSANLNVAGAAKFATQSGAKASIDQSAGKTTIGGQLTLGGANANTVEWDAHGEGTELEVNKVYAVTYRGNAPCGLTVRNGATLNVTGTVDLGHEGANATTPAGTAYLKVLDGATATIADFAFTGTGYGVVDVSNATLTVTGSIRGNGGSRAADGLERRFAPEWKKILLKGNHDFWWSTETKMNAYLASLGFDDIRFLHNNAFYESGRIVCGTRGWFSEDDEGAHGDFEKLVNREATRLKLSLDAAKRLSDEHPGAKTVAFFHFPPVWGEQICRPIVDLLHEYGVTECCFGHIHGIYTVPSVTEFEGISLRFISADYLDFLPRLL